MKIRYLKSATVAVECGGIKILTDPWLVDGEYYGAWHHYPPLEWRQDYLDSIDYIYVSHIHPDHFSRATFARLAKRIPVLIHAYASKFLKTNLERLGFKVEELPHNIRTPLKNGVHLNILAADNCNPQLCARFFGCGQAESKFGSTQIDTLAVIDDGVHTVVNTNDCPIELSREVLALVRRQYTKIDFLLVGYGGAGPYPQCFRMPEAEKAQAAEAKKRQFLSQAEGYVTQLAPRHYLPFAGTYALGGRLAALQDHRGVPEVEEARDFLEGRATIRALGSEAVLLNSYECFDLDSGTPSAAYVPIDPSAKRAYLDGTLASRPLDYESEDIPALDELLPLLDLAYERMERKRVEIGFGSDTRVLVGLPEGKYASISMRGAGYEIIDSGYKNRLAAMVAYECDSRLLHRILKGPRFAHWNNAEIGSHICFERRPNVFERGLHHAMNFFHA